MVKGEMHVHTHTTQFHSVYENTNGRKISMSKKCPIRMRKSSLSNSAILVLK